MKIKVMLAIAAMATVAATPATAVAAAPAPPKPASAKPTPAKPTPAKPASATPTPAKPTPATPTPATPTPATAKPTAAKPASRMTLTVADNGRQVRVHRGEQVLVRLSVNPRRDPDPTTWWRAIDESGRALQARPQTAIAIRGTTRGRYQAVARGTAVLSSSRAVCPAQNNGPTCHALQGWSVTVDVR